MELRTDRRVVDQIVKFATRDPRADGDVLAEMARHFPNCGDNFDGAVNHMLRMLRTYVALDDAEARVEPKAEVAIIARQQKPARRCRPRHGQLELFNRSTGR